VILSAGWDQTSQHLDSGLANDPARNLQEASITPATTSVWGPAAPMTSADDVMADLEAALRHEDHQL
jgi:hypothetical protein